MPPEELKTTMKKRCATNYYKSPARPGVSFMLSPVLRTYTNADEHGEVATQNFPHVMHYAPNLTRADIGGAQPGSPYPFLLFPGRHGYSIQMVGIAEREAINKEHAQLIERLCKLRAAWCLPEQTAAATTAKHEH